MKILFLTNSLEYGGIETNLVLLTEEFIARGCEVHIAARPGALCDVLAGRGAVVHDLEMRLRRPRALLRDRRRIRRVLRRERPDVVHVFSASAAILLASMSGRKPPVVASVMGLGDPSYERRWRTWARNMATVMGAKRILLISPTIEEQVAALPIRRRRLQRQDVVGIRLLDPGRFATGADVRDLLDLEAGQPTVMTTGRLAVRNAHHLFIQAAAHVHEHIPEARFFIIGEGPKRPELKQEIQRLGLSDVVILLGEVDNVHPYYAAADIYVRPGISEGFVGITVLEAQVLQVPVVSYETQDVRMAIEHGRTGLLVPRGDAKAMAECIVELLTDRAKAERLARAGRQHVAGRFDIRVIADGLLTTYRQTIDGGRRATDKPLQVRSRTDSS